MRLRDLFSILKTNNLDKPLLLWFKNCNNSIYSKIVSFQFTRELHLQAWDSHSLFIEEIKKFSKYLQSYNNDYDSYDILGKFFENNTSSILLGSICLKKGTLVNLLLIDYLIEYFKIPITNNSTDNDKLSLVIDRLEVDKYLIGHNGFTWIPSVPR